MERLRDILSSSTFRRVTVGLYVVALSSVVAIYIGISLLEVQTAAYIRGNATLEKNQPNPVRGGILDAPAGTFRHDVDVAFRLRPVDAAPPDSNGRSALHTLATGRPGAGGVLQESLKVPEEVRPGTYEMVVAASGPAIEPFEATSEVRVVGGEAERAQWPTRTSRIANEERRKKLESGPVEEQSGPIAIDVLPLDGELPRGLPGRLYLRTYDAATGAPVAARVRFDEVEGMGRWGRGSQLPEEVTTDTLGLAELKLEPVGGQKWHLRATELEAPSEADEKSRTGEATILVHTVASQVSISLRRHVLGNAGLVQGEAANLFRAGSLYVDLYRDDSWLHAGRARVRNRNAQFEIPLARRSGRPWLYRVQISRGFYDAGNSWDVRYVVDGAALDGSDRRTAAERVARFVAEHRDDPYFEHVAASELLETASPGSGGVALWVRAFLTAIPRHFSRTGTLFNTRASDRKSLERWKDSIQSDLMIVVGVGMLGGFAVLGYVVLVGLRRRREHEERLRDVDVELAAEDFEESPEREHSVDVAPGTSEKIQDGLLGLIALATFVMFALGMMLLLSYL